MIQPSVDFETMVADAEAGVHALSPEQVEEKLKEESVLLVDLRDVRELEREGRIPGSKHVPRGMLEFWIHPGSPYFKEYFNQASEIILHCNRDWRSALSAKALGDIGITVSHLKGGFSAWKEKGLPVEDYQRRS